MATTPSVKSEYYLDPATGQRYVMGKVMTTNREFTPSSYDADLTMNGTAQTGALATDAVAVQFGNLGATTEAIRVAFGTDATDAGNNLTIVTGAATTGYYIPAVTQGGANAFVVLGAPKLATHYAVANAVAAHVQVVTVTQGV